MSTNQLFIPIKFLTSQNYKKNAEKSTVLEKKKKSRDLAFTTDSKLHNSGIRFDKQINRQTDRQTDRQTGKKKARNKKQDAWENKMNEKEP